MAKPDENARAFYARSSDKLAENIKKRALDALKDDVGEGDATVMALSSKGKVRAVIKVREKGILAGMLEARAIFEDGGVEVMELKKDGDSVSKNEAIMELGGDVSEILKRERTALNYLQRMSAIATLSRKLAEKSDGRAVFLRKSDPGLLYSEKRAVELGGSPPNRIGLFDGIIIKENHITALAEETELHRENAIAECIKRAKKSGMKVEIEVENLKEAETAAKELGEGAIMLDNMTPEEVKACSKAIKDVNPGLIVEASGGINEENMAEYLEAGANFVSTSAFITKAGFLDFSLLIM